jgi:hypothetical protein
MSPVRINSDRKSIADKRLRAKSTLLAARRVTIADNNTRELFLDGPGGNGESLSFFLGAECPLLAQSGHDDGARRCLLLGVKRTRR